MSKLSSGRGEAVNEIKIGEENVLFGDPTIKTEKPHTIVSFPGASVEIARCEDGRYWIHVTTRPPFDEPQAEPGMIVDTRLNAEGRYINDGNEVLRNEIRQGDINHVAFLVQPSGRSGNGGG